MPSPTEDLTFPGDASKFGLGDVGDLRSAHQEALASANYRASLVVDANLTFRGISSYDRSVHTGTRDGQQYLRVRVDGREARDVFVGPETQYVRFSESGERRYRHHAGGLGNGSVTIPTLTPWPIDRLVGLLEIGKPRTTVRWCWRTPAARRSPPIRWSKEWSVTRMDHEFA
ncbi:hypothetical protein BRC81_07310 [Halobacteriales archaeon QS_1_68_20]|nr:MAG: hypothetical protein BRC81_07310 [Halobacteriales archaeon QS_1_68_20]